MPLRRSSDSSATSQNSRVSYYHRWWPSFDAAQMPSRLSANVDVLGSACRVVLIDYGMPGRHWWINGRLKRELGKASHRVNVVFQTCQSPVTSLGQSRSLKEANPRNQNATNPSQLSTTWPDLRRDAI